MIEKFKECVKGLGWFGMLQPMQEPGPSPQPPGSPIHEDSSPRTLLGGFLMGFANLVPGISGGTMILAVGLYGRFVGVIANLSRLRILRADLRFLLVFGAGAALALASLSGLLVGLVSSHRWLMYSLFVGMTLGGVPQILSKVRPLRGPGLGFPLVGLGLMAWLVFGLTGVSVPETFFALVFVGAIAASSMILPGISGSYLLLLFGLYETVIGSLSRQELMGNTGEALGILIPVALGAALGIALLSNVLKALLDWAPRPMHGLLLGLMLGSVLGLYPFQQPVHPWLSQKPVRKAVAECLADPALDQAEVREQWGLAPEVPLQDLLADCEGLGAGELKTKAETLERFSPPVSQVLVALLVLASGLGITRFVSRAPSVPSRD
jgi:putative membrane protein